MPPASRQQQDATHVVALLNQKGGVGKTTSTVNLGAALARAGAKVCLVDLDPQGHLTLHLGVEEPKRSVYDLLIDPECTAEEVIVRGARPNLDVILAEVDLAAAEPELTTVADRQTVLRRKLSEAAKDYDVVLIDCPPSLGLLTINALTFATELFVPMQAHFLALQGVGRLLETVGLVCRTVNPDLEVTGVILCMHESQTTLAREIVADLDAFFDGARDEDVPWRNCRVLRPPIRRNIKLAEAPSFGNTIFDYAPWCPGALDYRKLAERLLKEWRSAPAPAPAETPTPAETKSKSKSKSETKSKAKTRNAKPEPAGEASAVEVKPVDSEPAPKVADEPADDPTPEVVVVAQDTPAAKS